MSNNAKRRREQELRRQRRNRRRQPKEIARRDEHRVAKHEADKLVADMRKAVAKAPRFAPKLPRIDKAFGLVSLAATVTFALFIVGMLAMAGALVVNGYPLWGAILGVISLVLGGGAVWMFLSARANAAAALAGAGLNTTDE